MSERQRKTNLQSRQYSLTKVRGQVFLGGDGLGATCSSAQGTMQWRGSNLDPPASKACAPFSWVSLGMPTQPCAHPMSGDGFLGRPQLHSISWTFLDITGKPNRITPCLLGQCLHLFASLVPTMTQKIGSSQSLTKLLPHTIPDLYRAMSSPTCSHIISPP